MKIDWDFVQRIHRLLDDLPEKEKEYKILYPEAFQETEISKNVTCSLSGSRWYNLKISFIGKPVGKIILNSKKLYFRNTDEAKTSFRHFDIETEPGFKISCGSDGIRIWKYGPTKKEKEGNDLPF